MTAAEAMQHPWITGSGHNHDTVHLQGTMERLHMSMGKRKLRRTVNKIILLDRLEKKAVPKDYPIDLMTAVINNNVTEAQQGVCAAIDKGENVNGQDDEGKTVLMQAILHHNSAVASQLIGLKADVTIVDNQGKSALMYAAIEGDVTSTQRLLQANAEMIHVKDNFGGSAGSYAYTNDRPGVVMILKRFADFTPSPEEKQRERQHSREQSGSTGPSGSTSPAPYDHSPGQKLVTQETKEMCCIIG